MRMGRPRKYHRHLPRRVYHRHGAFWFVHPGGKWQRLGPTLPDAYRALARLSAPAGPPATIGQVVARYRAEVLPKKAERTQVDHARYLGMIEAVHGAMPARALRPVHIRQVVDQLGAKPTRANRFLEVYKHLLGMAVQWGAIDHHPGREVRRYSLPPRDRYVTAEEFAGVYALAEPMLQVAMDLAVLTGLRRADLLALTRDQLTEDGILVRTRKTGKPLLIQWSEELQAAVDRAWSLDPQLRRYVIANRRGEAYTPDGFSAVFRRVMLKVPAAGRFRWHDLRAKSASDGSLEEASARLGHTSAALTAKHYYRAPRKVRPLR